MNVKMDNIDWFQVGWETVKKIKISHRTPKLVFPVTGNGTNHYLRIYDPWTPHFETFEAAKKYLKIRLLKQIQYHEKHINQYISSIAKLEILSDGDLERATYFEDLK